MSEKERANDEEDPQLCRRVVLERALVASAVSWAAGMGVPAAIYLWPMRREGPGLDTANAGAAENLAVGDAALIKAREAPILVVRESPDEIHAFSAICTHLGCLVHWRKEEKDIYCPCHGGRFDLEGSVIGGPPPRPLPRYSVSIVEGEIQVNLRPG